MIRFSLDLVVAGLGAEDASLELLLAPTLLLLVCRGWFCRSLANDPTVSNSPKDGRFVLDLCVSVAVRDLPCFGTGVTQAIEEDALLSPFITFWCS